MHSFADAKLLQEIDERRLIKSCGSADALCAIANDYPYQQELMRDEWGAIKWYGDDVGGKLVIFKAGNPHLPKTGKRKGNDTLSDEEHEKIRLQNSLSRTKRNVYELAACNPWEWFFTGTLDGEKVDRNDLNGTFKKLSQWMRDYRKRQTGEKLAYLIVPEEHKKGGWHFHGLLHGLTADEMHQFTASEDIPARIKAAIIDGTPVWTWTAYARRFGYSTVTAIKSKAAVSAYVTKYITKDMVQEHRAGDTGQHLYYCSQGLKKAATAAEGTITKSYLPDCDFENDYLMIRNIKTAEERNAIAERYGLKWQTEQYTNYV